MISKTKERGIYIQYLHRKKNRGRERERMKQEYEGTPINIRIYINRQVNYPSICYTI